jgi:transcriptional regulator with XRE-family HTH domain
MTTLPTFTLSEPQGADRIPTGTLAYFRARLKQHVYSLVIREFKKSGLSQADLGRRLKKSAPQLSRLFSGPGNMTLDMLSDLLFAIAGAEPALSTTYPFLRQQVNPPPQPQDPQLQSSPLPAGDGLQLGTEKNQAIIDELRRQALAQDPMPV